MRERADEERREKKSRRKEKMENFKKLLEESGLTSKATFSDFATKVRLYDFGNYYISKIIGLR